MRKTLIRIVGLLLLAVAISACSSPEEKAADYISSGDELFAEGDYKKAEIEYRNALQINQNLPNAWFGLAQIHERNKEWQKTYATLSKIRELAPNHIEGRIKLGQLLLASNQLDEALKDAREILEMAPDNASAHALMAAVHFRLENLDEARQEVGKALAIDSGNTEALLVEARLMIAEENYEDALAILDGAIQANPKNVSFYLMKIQANQQRADRKAIEQVYLDLVDQFPENTAFRFALVRLYLEDKDVDTAEQVMEQIVALDPDNVGEKIRLAEFKNQYRSAAEAISLVESYIDSDPDEYRYRFLLGELYEKNQQIDQASSLYRDIVERDGLNTNGIEARNKLALIELRKGNVETARQLVDEVLAHDKSNENALLLLTGFQINDRNYDDALVSVRTVLRDNPESTRALALLGQAYKASGSTELAMESFRKAFDLSPGTPAIANELASALMRQRNYVQADEVLQKSFAGGNRSVQALKLYAEIKLARGEWDKAEQIAKELKNLEGQEAVSEQLMGVVYQGRQQQESSIAAFKKAHELAPAASQPIVALVQTYVRNNKVSEARQFLDSVIATNPDNVTAYNLLGQLSAREQKNAEALDYFQKIVEINPKLEVGYRSQAVIHRLNGDMDKAEAVVELGLESIPANSTLNMTLASIYEAQQKFEQAINIYESMLDENPDLLVAKNNLASLLTDQRGDAASLTRARTIAAEFKDSQIPQFRDTYAWASVVAGANIEEAVLILEGVIEGNEQVDVYNYHLGEAYRKNGETEKAKTFLEKAVSLAAPGSDVADKANESLKLLEL